jgi:hypothetical protein
MGFHARFINSEAIFGKLFHPEIKSPAVAGLSVYLILAN